jgi:3-hydroxyisobutyrate dehydrogenase-like beta-hydroxyacid dehydrogenase
MRKDLDLARRESAELGVELPAVHCAAERYAELVAKGLGDEDAAAVVELR